MVARTFALVTPEEYLARERTATTKSEYIAGEILAMAGGKPAHNTLCMDAALALGVHLAAAGGTCDVHNSEQKVRVDSSGPFFYPDVSVVCGEPRYDSDDCLRNPVLIVEVLSPSSADYDREWKFRYYRSFATMRHYILIDQEQIRVEHYRQQEGILWVLAGEYMRRSDSIALPDLGIEIPLAEIYRRITFS
jgi:Uma2 family endonuclease